MKKFFTLVVSLGLSVTGKSHLRSQTTEETITYLEANTIYVGNLGGNLFDDGFTASNPKAGPCQINYRAAEWIDGIQLVWDQGDGSCSITNPWHGGEEGGTPGTLTFARDKRVASAQVWLTKQENYLQGIKFYYEDGTPLDAIGKTVGMAAATIPIKGNLVGLQGRAAAFIDSISFISSVPSKTSAPRFVYWASEAYGGRAGNNFDQQVQDLFSSAKNIYFYLDDNSEIVGANIGNLRWFGLQSASSDKKCSLNLSNASEINTYFNENKVVGVTITKRDGTQASCGLVTDANGKATVPISEDSHIVGIYGAATHTSFVNRLGWLFKRSG